MPVASLILPSVEGGIALFNFIQNAISLYQQKQISEASLLSIWKDLGISIMSAETQLNKDMAAEGPAQAAEVKASGLPT